MQYNYDFEIAAVVVMAIVLLHFLFTQQFTTDKVQFFLALLVSCIGESVMNIVSSIGLANTEIVPQFWNELFVFAFFAFEGLSSYLILRYIRVLCGVGKKEQRWQMLAAFVPFLVFEGILCLNLFPSVHFFFYFENNTYYQGIGAVFGYFYIIYYFVLTMIVFMRNWERMDKRTKNILIIYSVTAVGAIFAQLMVRTMLLTGAANALLLLVMYMSLQNPEEMRDSITKLGNVQAFQMQLQGYIERGVKVWIVSVDLQKMHRLNRILGLENTDHILREIGRYLSTIAGDRFVFRTTAETFSVIALSGEEKERMVTQIKERFKEEWNVQENPVAVTTTIIVQQYPGDFSHINEFAEMLDYMIEQAHKSANLTVLDSEDRSTTDYKRKEKVEMALETALKEHKIEVFYQPIYSLKEKRIVSLEALARLKDEELGYIPPDEFIGLAEKNGSIIALGEQVLEESCRFLAKHVLSNDSLGINSIQVNVSVAQCFRLNLEETVLPIMEKYHIPPSMITLELTEGIAVEMPDRMLNHMDELGKQGIAFAMDDYGSGNSNCSYLIRFPFKEVKIDKEIVWAYFKNETAKIVLENEIRTLKKLGRTIVVEGIESREQSEAMEELGVDYIQGFFYGKPLPEMDCLRYIRNFYMQPVEYGKA